jgi:hypothetical protein
METYTHLPLGTTRQQIRLIQVRRDRDGPIHCDISTFDIEVAPPYRAISYMWGPLEPEHDLIVDNKRLSIRSNLRSLLLNLRTVPISGHMATESYYFWIDQICINQSDTLERNHQVRLMSEIYTHCQSVVVWLGNVPGSGDIVFYGEDFHLHQSLSALERLVRHPYFNRLWIVQEILLAPSIDVFVDGCTWIEWDDMKELVNAGPIYSGVDRIRALMYRTTERERES